MNRRYLPPLVIAAAACAPARASTPTATRAPAPAPTTAAATAAAVPSSLRAALERIRADDAWTLRQQVELCEIPAPPFKEQARGAEYARRMRALGYTNVRIDGVGNVITERAGAGGGPTVVIAGHLDTVFPEGTNVKTRQEGGRIYGPGISDDCRGLAVVLTLARAFQESGVKTPGTVYFVGNVGEEGPGNLRGTRNLYTRELNGKIDYFISVDGTGTGLTSAAVGSNRYRISYKGPGGHSYGAFGIPNPIHALGRAIAQIGDLEVPKSPKTTFNVGVISGGTSVNSIPFEGTMELDMRSESAQSLAAVDAQVQRILRAALDAENARWVRTSGERAERARLSLQVDTIGIRPAGSQPDSARIVRTALATAQALGFATRPGASSTDANVPIGMGLPGITIGGGGHGGGAHSLGEWYENGSDAYVGPQWAAMIVYELAGGK